MDDKGFWVTTAVALLIGICWVTSYILRLYHKEKLCALVSRCVVKGGSFDFLCYINDVMSEDEKYFASALNPPDQQVIHEILTVYQKELSEKFFNSRLKSDRWIIRLSEKDYFLLTLCSFLESHECDVTFSRTAMYTETDRTNHGYWGCQLYTANYVLTPFGLVYNKLYYNVRLYCETSKDINRKNDMLRIAGSIKERIDTNSICISVM